MTLSPDAYETALAQLRNPAEWCRAAQTLRDLSSPGTIASARTLLALLHAYESPDEANRQCLLQALLSLGAKFGADRLHAEAMNDGDEEKMRGALHLMEMFPDAAHLPALATGLTHPNRAICQTAQQALAAQYQTPEWEAVLIRLLASEAKTARGASITMLGRRVAQSASAKVALQSHLAAEADEALRIQIKRILYVP